MSYSGKSNFIRLESRPCIYCLRKWLQHVFRDSLHSEYASKNWWWANIRLQPSGWCWYFIPNSICCMQSTSLGIFQRFPQTFWTFGMSLRQVFIMWIQMKEKAPFRVVEMGAGGAIFNRKKNTNRLKLWVRRSWATVGVNKNGWSLQISCFSFGFWINGFCGENMFSWTHKEIKIC